ncbi:formate-dependent phosphoribosylglycinamide formyltransferase (GAR transformylase) [Bacillus sp. SLBN-57]
MHKKIDLDDSVYKLCTLHPELKAVMKDAGFQNITKPGMLETAGRIMTIPKRRANDANRMEPCLRHIESTRI